MITVLKRPNVHTASYHFALHVQDLNFWNWLLACVSESRQFAQRGEPPHATGSKIQNPKSKMVLALFSSIALAVPVVSSMSTAVAQSAVRICQPPRAGEYLLLVVSPTLKSQEQVRRALPAKIDSTACKYFNDTVTRIGGFTKIEDANSWQQYVKDIVGLPAYVAQGPRESMPPPTTTDNSQPREATPSPTPTYNPQSLGAGYAVLVDYFNQPEVANQVQQLLGRDVGLVSYGQRPYLLAIHTASSNTAALTLRRLSDRGLFTMLVDSRKVTLLRSRVLLD